MEYPQRSSVNVSRCLLPLQKWDGMVNYLPSLLHLMPLKCCQAEKACVVSLGFMRVQYGSLAYGNPKKLQLYIYFSLVQRWVKVQKVGTYHLTTGNGTEIQINCVQPSPQHQKIFFVLVNFIINLNIEKFTLLRKIKIIHGYSNSLGKLEHPLDRLFIKSIFSGHVQ